MRLLLVPFLLCILAASAASAQERPQRPQRIVSMNVCTDQLLMLLVEPERIAGVSWLAADADTSALAEQARDLPLTHGVAEEVIARDPDLVIAGTFTTRATVQLLRRLGYPVVDFAPESSFDDIRANLRKMGEAVGETERAEALVAQFDRDLAALEAQSAGELRDVFASYGVRGWTAGAGTLQADAAHAAGYDTLGERLGVKGVRDISIEQLIVSSPDLIGVVDRTAGPPSLLTQTLDHPALKRFMAQRASVDVPDALWVCGGPFTLEAARLIAAAEREELAPPPPGGEEAGGGGPKSKGGLPPEKARASEKAWTNSGGVQPTSPPPTPYPLPARGRGGITAISIAAGVDR